VWPASWLDGRTCWLLAMRSRIPFPVLPWEFSLIAEDPHSDHGLGSLYNLGLSSLPVLLAHTYHHHSHHRGNLTPLYGRSNLRSRLHFAHYQEGGPRSLYGHVVALKTCSGTCFKSRTLCWSHRIIIFMVLVSSYLPIPGEFSYLFENISFWIPSN
jgi:hypothetical protein